MSVLDLVAPREWPSLGWVAIEWMEKYLCHGPGDIVGTPLSFDDEMAQFLLDMYRLYPKEHPDAGRRVVAYGVLSLPKGRAKSELAGALVCFEFLGPCRFSHWDADGSPVGKPLQYPFIRPLATEEGQTGNTYGNVVEMLEHAKEHYPTEWRFGELDIGATRTYIGRNARNGEIRPSTAGAASKDGGKETFAVADEVHLYDKPELRDMHGKVRKNCRKRKIAQPWMLATTTMFEPGADSVAEQLFTEADSLQGHARKRYGFCFHHRQGTITAEKWNDDAAQLESLREAYGEAAAWMDLDGILHDEIRNPTSTQADGARYFHNQRWKGEGKAIDLGLWDLLAAPERTPGPSERTGILIGFDGSEGGRRADDTVLIGWTVEHKPHLFLIGRWRRPERAGNEYRVPRHQVRARVTEMRSDFDVRRMVCDPPGWRDEIDGPTEGWSAEFGTFLDEDGKEEPIVVEFLTNRPTRMGPAIDRFLEAVREQNFTHDGSPELREYAGNALLTKAKGSGDFSALAKPTEDEKIDGLVAAVIGYDELAHLPVGESEEAPSIW